MRLDDPVDEDDEGARRASDLDAASTERRDQEARNDRREEPLLRPHSTRDREGERQRQRDDPDLDPRCQIVHELSARVPLAQDADELGLELGVGAGAHGAGGYRRGSRDSKRTPRPSADVRSVHSYCLLVGLTPV